MSFIFFLLLNAILFIRPAEIVPALIGLPIYNVMILACLAASLYPLLGQLNARELKDRPLTVCVIGLLAAVMISQLARFQSRIALESGVEFGKLVLYYLLMVAVLNTPARIDRFLTWLALFIGVLAALALLQYHGYIDVPSLTALERVEYNEDGGEETVVLQLRSTGIFNDPNDLSLILLVGMGISVYRMTNPRGGMTRGFWVAPLCGFGYALMMTRSRGGFLAMLTAMYVLFQGRFGWRRAVPLAAVALPVMFFLFGGGRQTDISTGDTAQERIQLWADGLSRLRSSPLFGIGYNRYEEEMGLVAHNSFVHCFTELGLLGGTLFVSAFYYAIWSLHRVGRPGVEIGDPDLRCLRPVLMAVVAGYALGISTVSRHAVLPTYMILALVTAYLGVADVRPSSALPRLDRKLVGRFAAVSAIYLVCVKGFISLVVHWS